MIIVEAFETPLLVYIEARKASNITTKELAEKLGVSDKVVYGYHTETKQKITALKLHKVLIALGFEKIEYNLPKFNCNEH
jgi:transcriptional regulator with XRE-family HTH domain